MIPAKIKATIECTVNKAGTVKQCNVLLSDCWCQGGHLVIADCLGVLQQLKCHPWNRGATEGSKMKILIKKDDLLITKMTIKFIEISNGLC